MAQIQQRPIVGPEQREALLDEVVPPSGAIWVPFGMACGMLIVSGEQGINEMHRSVEKGDYLPIVEVARVSAQLVDPDAEVFVVLRLCHVVSDT